MLIKEGERETEMKGKDVTSPGSSIESAGVSRVLEVPKHVGFVELPFTGKLSLPWR